MSAEKLTMAVEAGSRPQPSAEQKGPTGQSLGGKPEARGIQVIPYVPRMGEMVQVYKGPVGPRDIEIVRIAVLEPPQKSVPWRRSAGDHVDAAFDPTSEGIHVPNGADIYTPTQEATPPPTPSYGDAEADEEIISQVWDKYLAEKNTARYTLIGKSSPLKAYYANRGLLDDMANAKVPTPPELDAVVAAYQQSQKEGKKAFMDFYDSLDDAA